MKIVKGSILDAEADAIVNPANSFLRHSGGLAAVIARAAAPEAGQPPFYMGEAYVCWQQDQKWVAEQEAHPLIPTGGAAATSAGRLPFKGIIHAVGPIWGGGHLYERELLSATMESVCDVAWEKGWRKLAVPAISCGVFGFPVEQAAKILTKNAVFAEDDGDVDEITFYLMEDEHVTAFKRKSSQAPYIETPIIESVMIQAEKLS